MMNKKSLITMIIAVVAVGIIGVSMLQSQQSSQPVVSEAEQNSETVAGTTVDEAPSEDDEIAATETGLTLENVSTQNSADETPTATPAVSETFESDPLWISPYLESGDIQAGLEAFTIRVNQYPNNENLIGLSILQMVKGIENITQFSYKHGFGAGTATQVASEVAMIQVGNPSPETISYSDLRSALDELLQSLERVQATLDKVDYRSSFELPALQTNEIKIDFNGDSEIGFGETLPFAPWSTSGFGGLPENNDYAQMTATYHAASYLVAGALEILMALDSKDLFEHAAHLIFPHVDSPYTFLQEEGPIDPVVDLILDVTGLTHFLGTFLIGEPNRIRKAFGYAQKAREIFQAEFDRLQASDQLTEWEAAEWNRSLVFWKNVMDGELLIPFWRGQEALGINIKKLFENPPRSINFSLWLQGTEAMPYLESGPTIEEFWNDLQNMFGFPSPYSQ